MSSKFYIQTRGKALDYCFLLQEPRQAWWRSYGKYTSFEHSTLIIEREGEVGKFYLSGIPSSRKDRVNTVIRYTIVAEFTGSEEQLIPLVKYFLDEFYQQANSQKLGEIFDEHFSEEYIEESLLVNDDNALRDKLTEKINALLLEVQKPVNLSDNVSSDPSEDEVWWGGLKNDESSLKWLSSAKRILKGGSGKALMLNLASGKSLQDLCQNSGTKNVALLIPESGETPKDETPKVIKEDSIFEKFEKIINSKFGLATVGIGFFLALLQYLHSFGS